MNKRSKKIIAQGVYLMLIAILMLAVGAAQAQELPNVLDLPALTPESDWSMRLWRSLLGDFADDPFGALGAPSTLLGGVFVIFNGCVFVLGTVWATYGILGGVVGTAHEGEVLGKRMSTVWFPIRMVTGIAGMVPIFGGFTMNQAVMMFLTTIGIGIGNLMWTGAVNNTAQFQGLMNNQAFAPAAVADARQVARNMFASNVCLISETHVAAMTGEETITGSLNMPLIKAVASVEDGTSSYTYGTKAHPTKCGQASVKASPSWLGNDYRSGSDMLAFRSGGVDYKAIESQSIEAKIDGLTRMQQEMQQLALKWYVAREAARQGGEPIPEIPLAEIDKVATTYTRSTALDLAKRLADKTPEAVTESAKANMLAVGWFGAGAWFSTFAEANAATADAAKVVKLNSTFAGTDGHLASATTELIDGMRAGFEKAQQKRAGGAAGGNQGDGSSALLDSAIEDSCAAMPLASGFIGTATGNCSLGQGIVSAAIRSAAVGSGGGGGGGVASFDSEGLVNPIIMMKNLGDYVMTFSSSVISASAVVQGAAWATEAGSGAISGMPVLGQAAGAVNAAAKEAGDTAATIKAVAIVTLVLGAAMAIYIPMIPFITWIGAILAYAASMIEGLAGATLHSMAHLDSEGEGMGQRTAHGYMFYVNAIARPGLMIIGFFFASAVMISVGTLQAQMFLPAMANVQGNSVTGFFSIAMFLVIFAVMNITLITTSFNLIYVITDQVIGFVGGQVGQKLGQDTEDKTNNMFMMAARAGNSGASEVKKGVMADKATKAASAARKD